jgi:hypothetical protein
MAGGDARPTGFSLISDPWYLAAHRFNRAAAQTSTGYNPYIKVIPGGLHGSADVVDPELAYAHGRLRPGIL